MKNIIKYAIIIMGGSMYNKAIDILKIFNSHGYNAYIVGGFPRDKILGIESTDIDICTDAKPKEIMEIFDIDGVSDIKYGYVRVIYKNSLFDVTTFRKDIKYENNRKPIKIKYVNELKKDLLRRDFTINTICIDCNKKILDILGGIKDIEARVIKTVGNPRYRLKEDSLRILRAIRFASNLDFEIDNKTKVYIKKYGYLLKNLSGDRKREELDKILTSRGREKGRDLIISLGLDKHLGISNLKDIVLCDDIIGVWSQLVLTEEYPFSKHEKNTMKKINQMIKLDINNYNVYKYGLYISSVVASIKNISYKKVNQIFKKLPINSRKDIDIEAKEIAKLLNKEMGEYLSIIINDLEEKIVNLELDNNKEKIKEYIIKKYKED